jgi:hypothetical protein
MSAWVLVIVSGVAFATNDVQPAGATGASSPINQVVKLISEMKAQTEKEAQ